ncbi:LOB domain-containing protein 12 [Punica granatum]|uniref:LOB domain-containing protein n=2 Tax=Punica granatum TaxID=22663 RepID=A0A218W291_PUNGR|nr:LOB domain-containing protein 12 [Punica granatum]OWM66663.1 hypothetical protein CDL15_Pgr010314 [Punica granatum]PKI66579.1 hypothetical protein CRG98_013023 [Punica granatum]
MAGGSNSPCASCKLLRRRCAKDCIFAPYFRPDEPKKFAIVHKVFGASNVSKMLQELPVHQRADAVNSLVYEASARVRDPVYGCVGAISCLQNQVSQLQLQLAVAQAEILSIQMQQPHQQQQEQEPSLLLPSPSMLSSLQTDHQDIDDDKSSTSLLLSSAANIINNNQLNLSGQYFGFASSVVNVVQDPLKRESLWI